MKVNTLYIFNLIDGSTIAGEYVDQCKTIGGIQFLKVTVEGFHVLININNILTIQG